MTRVLLTGLSVVIVRLALLVLRRRPPQRIARKRASKLVELRHNFRVFGLGVILGSLEPGRGILEEGLQVRVAYCCVVSSILQTSQYIKINDYAVLVFRTSTVQQ